MLLESVLAFLGGLLIGSFLNVCVYRLPRDLSVVKPRSFCPGCEKMISWYDNVPVLSFLILRGRCRHCKEGIPLRYPLVELTTGIAFALCVYLLGLTLPALKYAIFSAILITLIASDFEERILPDEFTIGGFIVGMLLTLIVPLGAGSMFGPVHILFSASLAEPWISVAEGALGAGFASGSIWLVGWLYQKFRHRDGLGLGDVKMLAMIGAFLGLNYTLLVLMAASLIGAIGGIGYALLTRKEMSTYELPFGSFLGAAALVVAMWTQVFAR